MLWIKYVHVACAILSGAGYFVRGLWMMRESPLLQKAWVKVAPHIIDTALLASAILLALQLRLNPLDHGWFTAKLIALVAYIVVVALTRQVFPYIG